MLLSAAAFARQPSAASDDWLPIPPADLALKDNPADPGASAMILYRDGEVVSQDFSIHEYVRIKIFTQEGIKEGDVKLPFAETIHGHRGYPRPDDPAGRQHRQFRWQSRREKHPQRQRLSIWREKLHRCRTFTRVA